MEAAAPGLHRLRLGIVNAYLLETPEGLVLVDTGFPGSERKILAAVAALGRAPGDLKHIVSTHAHPDHIGSLAALRAATGAKTWMHALDAPQAERAEMRPVHPAPGVMPALLFGVMRRVLPSRVAPARIDHAIAPDEAELPFGGKYLARATAAAAYEAGLKDRIVISEFPSVEQATAAYNSPGYQSALKALGDGAVRDIRIVAGLE